MSKQIRLSARERNAIFPFVVQRKNPKTKRWYNISFQSTEEDAEKVRKWFDGTWIHSRIVKK